MIGQAGVFAGDDPRICLDLAPDRLTLYVPSQSGNSKVPTFVPYAGAPFRVAYSRRELGRIMDMMGDRPCELRIPPDPRMPALIVSGPTRAQLCPMEQ